MAKRTLTYGFQPVLEALEALELGGTAGRRLFVSVKRKRELERVLGLAQRLGLEVEWLEGPDMDALCAGGNHQGVALEGREFAYGDLGEVLRGLVEGADAVVVVLDQVQDPMNLGAVVRTAAALGAAAVVLPERRSVGVTAAVIKASAGQVFRVPVVRVVNLGQALEQLKEAGFWVAGAATRGGQAPWEANLKGRIALVLGSEGAGMRRLVEEGCDLRLTLPLAQGVESLNVASAGAMLLYEVARQRARG